LSITPLTLGVDGAGHVGAGVAHGLLLGGGLVHALAEVVSAEVLVVGEVFRAAAENLYLGLAHRWLGGLSGFFLAFAGAHSA
jgi:hypothetical protein